MPPDSGVTLPTVYRHTVDNTQTQNTIPFTRKDRIPNPPNPMAFYYQHSTGTNFLIDVSGNVSVSGVPVSGTLTMQFQELLITINQKGFINVASTAASGENVILQLDATSSNNGTPIFRTKVAGANSGGWQNLNSSGVVTAQLLDLPTNATILDYATSLDFRYGLTSPAQVLTLGNSAVGFFGATAVTKQTVTGMVSAVTDPNAKATLISLLTALIQYGLITNGTT
jgi:hypothetical protein